MLLCHTRCYAHLWPEIAQNPCRFSSINASRCWKTSASPLPVSPSSCHHQPPPAAATISHFSHPLLSDYGCICNSLSRHFTSHHNFKSLRCGFSSYEPASSSLTADNWCNFCCEHCTQSLRTTAVIHSSQVCTDAPDRSYECHS